MLPRCAAVHDSAMCIQWHTCIHFAYEGSARGPQFPGSGHTRASVPVGHGPEESWAWNLTCVHYDKGMLRMGQVLQSPVGREEGDTASCREGKTNGDGGVRTAKTTDLLLSQYHFWFISLLFLLTMFSFKFTNGCKILSFKELTLKQDVSAPISRHIPPFS